MAALWGARAAGDRREPATACRMVDAGLALVGADVELRNQLEFQRSRCQSLAAQATDSARAAVADSVARAQADSLARARGRRPAARPPAPARSQPGYYVQISAVLTQAAADGELARAKRAGYNAVVVKEGGYLKIRAGGFRNRQAAEAALAQLKTRLGGHPFLVRVP
jgi:cell division septation protein DedD